MRRERHLHVKAFSFIILLFLVSLVAGSLEAQTLYPEDLAKKLASPKDVRKITNIRARLKRTAKKADPFFILTPPPFGDIEAAPNELAHLSLKPKSWDIPPWPAVDPAPPTNLTEEERKQMEERRIQETANVWSELPPAGGDENAPSAMLRPRRVPIEEQFVFRIKEIPEPFSLRRYYDNEDIFMQVAAYGGTTSFKAEEAFRAMKEAAVRQTDIEGMGQEAFLTRVEISEPEEEEVMPFEGLEPEGEERPDLMDSGSAVALLAPAFQDLPVKDLEGRRVTYVEPIKRYKSDTPDIKQSLLVIVAFFPDQALTVSVALEERLGSVQDLIAICMMVQRKVTKELKRG